jgi:hypothetical protein
VMDVARLVAMCLVVALVSAWVFDASFITAVLVTAIGMGAMYVQSWWTERRSG